MVSIREQKGILNEGVPLLSPSRVTGEADLGRFSEHFNGKGAGGAFSNGSVVGNQERVILERIRYYFFFYYLCFFLIAEHDDSL